MSTLQVETKSEKIVELRSRGMKWRDIAAEVGTSEGCCRVLFHKRRWRTKSLLASDAAAEWVDGEGIVNVRNADH